MELLKSHQSQDMFLNFTEILYFFFLRNHHFHQSGQNLRNPDLNPEFRCKTLTLLICIKMAMHSKSLTIALQTFPEDPQKIAPTKTPWDSEIPEESYEKKSRNQLLNQGCQLLALLGWAPGAPSGGGLGPLTGLRADEFDLPLSPKKMEVGFHCYPLFI
jgi:hypothetical protein